uniref:Uncharacterized protein n=1 Tax=Opuntia streptacantha TaxID=393608 RepID=A0A7C9D5T1_OPUST
MQKMPHKNLCIFFTMETLPKREPSVNELSNFDLQDLYLCVSFCKLNRCMPGEDLSLLKLEIYIFHGLKHQVEWPSLISFMWKVQRSLHHMSPLRLPKDKSLQTPGSTALSLKLMTPLSYPHLLRVTLDVNLNQMSYLLMEMAMA